MMDGNKEEPVVDDGDMRMPFLSVMRYRAGEYTLRMWSPTACQFPMKNCIAMLLLRRHGHIRAFSSSHL